MLLVQNEDLPAAHSRSKIFAGGAKDNNHPSSHVFTAMIADTLNNRHRTGIANRKPLAGHSVKIGFAAGCSVKRHIAHNNVF